MKRNTDMSRTERKQNVDTCKLEKQYTSRSGFEVRSYVRILSDTEREKSRTEVTEEVVRILRSAGRL